MVVAAPVTEHGCWVYLRGWTRLVGDRWPGLQAPQHTVLFSRRSLTAMAEAAGLRVVEYLPYGAFPAYYYLFCGVAFQLLRGRGLNVRRALLPYLLGQVARSALGEGVPIVGFYHVHLPTFIARPRASKLPLGSLFASTAERMTWRYVDYCNRYCDRVVGMRDGRVVFDGTPAQLTTGVARDIYGAGADFSEAATSTEIREHDAVAEAERLIAKVHV